MRFLARKRFNYLDLIGLFILICLIASGEWFLAVAWAIFGPQLVEFLTVKYGGK